MRASRRHFLHLMAGSAALPVGARFARAGDYPRRPVHIIVGYGAGSTPDLNARLVGQRLTEVLGQSFVVENRPGAGTNLAAEAVVRAPADGHTLLFCAAPNAINATLYSKLSFNFISDIAPVASLQRVPLALVASPSFPATTIPQLIAYAKANPGKISVGSPGIGTVSHLAGELFKFTTGVDMLHVPYRGGGGALASDVMGGQLQMAFVAIGGVAGYVQAGKLRVLAVTSAMRLASLPDIPAIGEFVPGYEAVSWEGLGAPRGTPPSIIDRLNREVDTWLADPAVNARLVALGGAPTPMSPADFARFIAAETEKWGSVIRAIKLKLE